MKKLLLSLAAMLIGTVSLFAEQKVVTITGADSLWTTTAGAQTGIKEGVTIAVTNGTLGVDKNGKYPPQYRSYKDGVFTVSVAEGAITKIEVECTAVGAAKYGPGNFTAAAGDYTFQADGKVGTWTGNAASVELTSATAQVRMNTITVTYEVGGGTVTPAPDPVSLALTEGAAVKTEYKVGDTFDPKGLVATVTMSDKTTKDVTNQVAWTFEPAVVAADTKSVNVTASYKNLTASKAYNITIKEAPVGEQVVMITGEDNLWSTTAGAQTGSKADVTIATGEGMMGAYNNVGHYRVYKSQTFTVTVATGKITSIEVVCTANGDAKWGPGNFTAAVGTYTYDANGKAGKWEGESEKVELVAEKNQVRMESIKVTYVADAAAPQATSLVLTEALPVVTECYVGDKFSVENLKATAVFADKSEKDVTDLAVWTCEPAVIAQDTKTVTVTAAYQGVTASKTYDITVKSIANTQETAYTVEEAVALIDAGKGLNTVVFVKGIISNVESFNEKFGSITYTISTDGTATSQQFKCYGGLNIGGEKFTAQTDLTAGTEVVVKGKLKKYGDIYEFDVNNEIVSSKTTGIDDITIEAAQKDGKVVENGKVVVLKAGKKFLVNGQRIK